MCLVQVGVPLEAGETRDGILSTNDPYVLENADLSVSGLHVEACFPNKRFECFCAPLSGSKLLYLA